MATIAILGATGHVGKGLAYALAQGGSHTLRLYARDPDRVLDFLKTWELSDHDRVVHPMDEFGRHPFDAVVNATGAGDPARLRTLGAGIFRLTETVDNRILDLLTDHPERLYLNISSGAVYGAGFAEPARQDTIAAVPVNDLGPGDAYAMAKRHAEAKHRAHTAFNIVDLRIFSYFSRFIDLEGRFFTVDLARSLRDAVPLTTNCGEMDRDYVVPDDLAQMVQCCLTRWTDRDEQVVNDALDFYSKAPVGKFELIEAVQRTLPLQVRVEDETATLATGGAKSRYYSENHRAADWGYAPRFTSADGVVSELNALLNR
ncbi:NAD(P)-dependent oxidoreductase [Magnetospira sp. QH-2]|uniref:NAD-dependent epimerase/dehydratase family protein n=1 Tax=Magnetospira sp. (strain QH-2) TaxID=1288970 RepID=UPI0003E81373|nr:NAD-dependent epimerase/dehydratase family protein [Magnetospira sp. QH-2]CCQ75637.1 conserved protein of unknown function[Include NmrA-like family domain] [Magnetospira sp. QH-2]